MKLSIYINLLFMVVLGGCKSCEKEEVLPKKQERLAHFTIYEDLGYGNRVATDTVLNLYKASRFVASIKGADKYEWRFVGDSKVFSDTAISFSNLIARDVPPSSVVVVLKVWKRNLESQKIEIDSFSRIWTTVQLKDSKMIGTYDAVNSLEGHPYNFEFGLLYDPNQDSPGGGQHYVNNFPEGCDGKKRTMWNGCMSIGFNSVLFFNNYSGSCKEMYGFFELKNESLIGSYTIVNPEFPLEKSKRIKGTLLAIKL